MSTPGWRVGADVGGTFTDLVAMSADGRLTHSKVSSTAQDYSRAIIDGVRRQIGPDALREIAELVHATTVATNAILEGREADIALITTEGFRDVLELRRARRPLLYDLTWTPPPPLVERYRRLEVAERVGSRGEIVIALTEAEMERVAGQVRDLGVRAVAVCLLNSYVNGEHERRLVEHLGEAVPEVRVTSSSAIAPELREFERLSTTVVNAFLLPVVEAYLTALERALVDAGMPASPQVMQSDGTTASASVVRTRPFLIIESGPAAGVSAAARLAREMDRDAVVTFDMGGTTAKASLVEGHRVALTEELEVGDSLNRGGGLTRGFGYVVRSAAVDLTEVGSGGGSIAWIDGGGALRVGPRSAGSDPGPACYAGGGAEPTVTDAHVVLGYVNPTAIAGGTKPIDPERAEQAIRTVSGPLGLSKRDAAYGIYAIATATMRRAVRAVTVERGRDPGSLSLIAFGGAGGLHAVALADDLEMPEVIVPILSGVFSSLGLLLSDASVTRLSSFVTPLSAGAAQRLHDRLAELETEATRELLRQHPEAAGEAIVEHLVALRYVGQSTALVVGVQLTDGEVALDRLRAAFHEAHRRAYGQAAEDEEVEAASVRVSAAWRPVRPSFEQIAGEYLATEAPVASGEATRDLYFGPSIGVMRSRIVSRADLPALGSSVDGPLVIEEPGATIVVPPEFLAGRDATGSIVIRPARPSAHRAA